MVTEVTDHFSAIKWAERQGQFMPSGAHQSVLFYLTSNAFYTLTNPERGEIGQVMEVASKSRNICAGTGIKSRTTVREILTDLQMMAYVQREVRTVPGRYGQQSHLIYVHWDLGDLQQGLRDGTRTLPQALRDVPSARPQKPRKLALVVDLPLEVASTS